MFFPTTNITTDILHEDIFLQKGIEVSVLRTDKIDPLISGNKWFKLHYFLEAAQQTGHRTIVTFGGAWSNHLVATAAACNMTGLKSIGIVRGEEPAQLSHTLQQCIALGMHLQFISREGYAQKDTPEFLDVLTAQWGAHVLVPEGGYHPLGAKGAALMLPLAEPKPYTHIACALGTATTVAGLLLAAPANTTVMGFSALKGMTDIAQRLACLLDDVTPVADFLAVHDYSFGGYAKQHPLVIDCMNRLWQTHQLSTDFVYTGKLLYGVYDMATKGFFPPGSKILCIHTGGLQGNRSLIGQTLTF